MVNRQTAIRADPELPTKDWARGSGSFVCNIDKGHRHSETPSWPQQNPVRLHNTLTC